MVVVGINDRKRTLVATDAAAQAVGVRVGMPAAKAQILVPDLSIHTANPQADVDALARLAVWCLRRYTPVVATDPPDGIIMDTTGADHLHSGELNMLTDLVDRLARAGVSARVAVADTWGAAHAAARYAAKPIAVVDGTDRVMSLPLLGLRLSPETVAELHGLGFKTIGDLFDQPRAPLVLRFGANIGRRLDQVVGIIEEPIDRLRSPDLIEVRQAFGEPIAAAETIARYITKLAGRLCQQLQAQGLGARRLDLICHRVDARAQAIRVGLAQPTRDPRHLARLLSRKIELIDPGFGIELLAIAASWAETLPDKQLAMPGREDASADLSDLVDILANRIGENRIYRAAPLVSDVPERSIGRVAAMAPCTGSTWPGHWPRPARLLVNPELIETVALLPDHPPVTFVWRGIRRRIKRADGPERIFGEWWRDDTETAAVRDYFRVEDEIGERYWIYRAGDGEDTATGSQRWYLHGIFG